MPEPVTSPELRRLLRLFTCWPCSIRLKRLIAEERARLERQRAAETRALRGEIRQALTTADPETLRQVRFLLEARA